MRRWHLSAIIRVIGVLLLLVIQFLIFMLIPKWLEENAVWLYLIIELFSIVLVMPLVAENTNSAYKIFWLIMILLFPVSGHIMYELWGKEETKKNQHNRIQDMIDHYKKMKTVDEKLQEEICKAGIAYRKVSTYLCNNGYPAYKNTEMTYFSAAQEAYTMLLTDMRHAEKYIFLSSFTIADGHLWEEMSEILRQKANLGVEIKIMYDDAGSLFTLSDVSIKKMKMENIEIRKFNSIEKHMHKQYFQHRNHQNIVIVDGKAAYTGGTKISDWCANRSEDYAYCKNTVMRLHGEAVYGMLLIFLGMWNRKGNPIPVEAYQSDCRMPSEEICQPYADGPANNPDNPARDIYHLLAVMAEKELFIMTPYLILDDETRECLCLTAKSGVDVKIITPGKQSNKRAKLLTEWNYGALLKAGVHIYEYTPGFIYAKTCINDTSGIIGTVNMDFRSFYLHYECGVWFANSHVREQIHEDFCQTLTECREITLSD